MTGNLRNVVNSCLSLSVLAASICSANLGPRNAEIHGTVKDCWLGKTVIPVKGITVYAYDLNKGKHVLAVLQEIQQFPPEMSPTRIEDFSRLYDKLINTVETTRTEAHRTRTSDLGEFVIKGLKAGVQYLVLAIAPEKEDEVSYYDYLVTEELKPGSQRIKLWMGIGSEETCRNSSPEL